MIYSDNYRFENISIKEGLPSANVFCAIQDRLGFIWFGTELGISKYDGIVIKNYFAFENFSSPLNSPVYCSFEDSMGTLWFGSKLDTLIEYDCYNDNLIIHEVSSGKYSDKLSHTITSICEDSYGYLWISTYSQGLYRYDRKFKSGIRINFNNDFDKLLYREKIRNIIVTNNNELIIATSSKEIFLLNLTDNTIEQITNSDIGVKSFLNFVIEGPCNNYFLGLTNGLWILNLDSKVIKDLGLKLENEKDINSLCIGGDSNFWLGLYNGGLLQVDYKTKEIKMFSSEKRNHLNLENQRVKFLFKDRSDVMWICTYGSGIFKIDTINKHFHFFKVFGKKEKDKEIVNDIKIDKNNNLWVSTFLKNIYKYDFLKDDFKSYNKYDIEGKLINYPVKKIIYEDSKNNLWLGAGGLFKYISEKETFIEFGNLLKRAKTKIFTISEYTIKSKHYLLIGGVNHGITCIDTITGTINEFPELLKIDLNIKESYVNLMFLDSKNNLWFTLLNQNGVFQVTYSDFLVKHYSLNFINNIGIKNIFEDSANNLWFCSTVGLFKYVKNNNSAIQFKNINGLPANIFNGIIEDNKSNIWVSTNSGIFRYDKKTDSFKNYDYNDGLLNEQFLGSCCIDKDGILYFGGINGIDYFNPDDLKDNPFIPNIVITDFLLFNESIKSSNNNPFLKKNIEYTDEINLTYKENIFSFEFAALVFNNPKQNQYAYKMEGFDKDWVYCGTKRTATYTNLDPGEYIFRVKGSNNDGLWNEEGTSVKITISPPYWKTWWFKGLGLMSIVASAGYYYKQKLEKLEYESNMQIEFSRKLIDTQENEKKRIAHELHDTIAHDVLISKNKALLALKHENDNIKMKKALEEISELSSSTIADVRNIAYNLHPHQLERLGFTKTIKSIINEVSDSTNINFIFESDDVDEILSKESEINLFRVIQESISNIIKHSMATEVILKVTKSIKFLSVLIIDNGKGFDIHSKKFAKAKEGFGLSGIAERIKFMNGEIKIDSELDKGTSLKFLIPIVK